MSLYPKIFLVECFISVPNFMLVSSIAQFYQKFAHICQANTRKFSKADKPAR